ncbi:MAG: hypothetical protein Q9186_002984 [Xanthomendoza sp. 1 TL-2023]
MSKLGAFVHRAGSPNDTDAIEDVEKQQRMQVIMKKIGIKQPLLLIDAKDRSSDDHPKGRTSSRQAIGDRSRVSTSAFQTQQIPTGKHTRAQRPQGPQKNNSATSPIDHSRLPIQPFAQAQAKSLGTFDTDSEAADVTGLSSLTSHIDLPIDGENRAGDRRHPAGLPNEFAAARLDRESRHYHGSSHAPSFSEYGDMEEESFDHDGDDEIEDPTQYENPKFDQALTARPHLPAISSVPAKRERSFNETVPYRVKEEPEFDNSSNAPKGPKASRKSELSSHYHRSHTNGAMSISSAEDESEKEDARHLPPPSSVDYSMVIPDRTGEPTQTRGSNGIHQRLGEHQDTANGKRKFSPQPVPQRPIKMPPPPAPTEGSISNTEALQEQHDERGGPIQQSQHEKLKAEIGLDYDPQTLAKMTFEQLATESFDTAPGPTKPGNPSLGDESTLNERLLHLHALDGPKEQIHSQRQAFFSSLPIDQYEECGDLMTERFGNIILKFKEARQRKRAIAREFEEEVAKRQELVERRKGAVEDDMERLKRAGRDVVRGGR